MLKIVFFSFVAVFFTYIFIALFNEGTLPFSLSIDREPTIVLQDIELDQDITSIDLQWYSGGVTISKSDDGKIHVLERSSKQLAERKWVKPEVKDKTLIVHSKNTSNFFWFFSQYNTSYLELQLPEQSYDWFQLELTSGDYFLTDFSIRELEISMTSGDMDILNVNSDVIELSMTSGDTFLNNVNTQEFMLYMTSGRTNFTGEVTDVCEIEMTSGSLELDTSASALNELDIEMTSGKATLILSELVGFQIVLDKTSGNFKPDSQLRQVNANLYQYLDYQRNYAVEMTSGSLSIKLN